MSIIIKNVFTVVVQAGGESRRMGQDKALVLFRGQPLILRVLQRLESLQAEVLVNTNHPQEYAFLNVPLITDIFPRRGALGGLYTALSYARYPEVAVVACDMPFANPRLLEEEHRLLIETQSDAVIPRSLQGNEPFHALYRRATCLPRIESALQAGKWRVDSWFAQAALYYMPIEEIRAYDPKLICFYNINTLEELKEAERLDMQP